MVKSNVKKKILLFVFSVLMAFCVFFGVTALTKTQTASATDAKSGDLAVYNKVLAEELKSRPYWKSNVMYNETAIMWKRTSLTVGGSSYFATLQYTPLKVLAVTNYDGSIVYKEGVDYSVNGNHLVRSSNSSIPTLDERLAFATDVSTVQSILGSGWTVGAFGSVDIGGKGVSLLGRGVYTEGELFNSNYICVSYVYDNSSLSSYVYADYVGGCSNLFTQYDGNYFARLRSKLVKGNTINMLIVGDSITQESSSSSTLNIAPYQRGYAKLVAEELERVYGVKVNYNNIAKGGSSSGYFWGQNAENSAVGDGSGVWKKARDLMDYDLAIIAYGMNDIGGRTNFQTYVKKIVDELRADSPDCSIVLVNTYPGNPVIDATGWGVNRQIYDQFNWALTTIATNANNAAGNSECRVINVHAIGNHLIEEGASSQIGRLEYDSYRATLDAKRYPEISASNNNHPNDWMHRVYAMSINAAITNYDSYSDYLVTHASTGGVNDYATVDGWVNIQDGFYGDNQWSNGEAIYKAGDTNVISDKVGLFTSYDRGGAFEFALVNGNMNVNLQAFDVSKPISWQFAVNREGTGGDYNSGGWGALFGSGNVTYYGFQLLPTLSRAFMDNCSINSNYFFNAMSDANSVTLQGSNSSMHGSLYGKLAFGQAGNSQNPTKFFDENAHTADTSLNQFRTVTVIIGETSTTAYVEGQVIGTTTSITRSNFPNGVAYLRVLSNGNLVMKMKPSGANQDLSGSWDASQKFSWKTDFNGWSTNTQIWGTYNNVKGEAETGASYGVTGYTKIDDYSYIHLASGGYVTNYRGLDVTKPIQVEYAQDPSMGGDLNIGLFPSIEKAHKSASDFVYDDSAHAGQQALLHIRSANVNCTYGSYQLNKGVLVNRTYYRSNVYSATYDANNYIGKTVRVTFNVGDNNTTVYIDGLYMGTLNVKRADFTEGVAYASVCGDLTGTSSGAKFAIKLCQDVDSTGKRELIGTYDANGFYVSGKDSTAVNSLGILTNGSYDGDVTTDSTNGYYSTFRTNQSWTFNNAPITTDKELIYSVSMNRDATNYDNTVGYIMLFASYDDMITVGINGWNKSVSKYVAYITFVTGTPSGSTSLGMGSIRVGVGDKFIRDINNANFLNGETCSVRIYLAENAANSYIKMANEVVISGESIGLTRADFPNGVVYSSFIGMNGEQKWMVRNTWASPSVNTTKMTGTSISIKDSLNVNATAIAGLGYDSPTMKFTFDRDNVHADQTATVAGVWNGSGYTFSGHGVVIDPQYMNRNMTVQYFLKDFGSNNKVIESQTFSVRDYVMGQLNATSDAKYRAVLVDLLKYGAAAQKYAEKDTGDLATNQLSSTQLGYGATFNTGITAINSKSDSNNVRWAGMNLECSEKIGLMFLIDVHPNYRSDSNIGRLSVKLYKSGTVVGNPVPLSNERRIHVEHNGTVYTVYYVTFEGLSPTEFDAIIKAEILVDGSNDGAYCESSVNSYCAMSKDATGVKGELVKALYCYGVSAKAYAG